jgi:hypothetical protein
MPICTVYLLLEAYIAQISRNIAQTGKPSYKYSGHFFSIDQSIWFFFGTHISDWRRKLLVSATEILPNTCRHVCFAIHLDVLKVSQVWPGLVYVCLTAIVIADYFYRKSKWSLHLGFNGESFKVTSCDKELLPAT